MERIAKAKGIGEPSLLLLFHAIFGSMFACQVLFFGSFPREGGGTPTRFLLGEFFGTIAI